MNLALTHPRRITVLAAILILLAATVTISAEPADAAAPAPISFSLTLSADPNTGECVGELQWAEGKGQIYVQMLLFRDVNGNNEFQASFAGKVSTSGDPRGSRVMTHTFSTLLNGGGDGQILDITIKTAKGKNGASGDPIGVVSMMLSGETASCG